MSKAGHCSKHFTTISLNLPKAKKKNYCYARFTSEETAVKKDKLSCPKSQAEPGLRSQHWVSKFMLLTTSRVFK